MFAQVSAKKTGFIELAQLYLRRVLIPYFQQCRLALSHLQDKHTGIHTGTYTSTGSFFFSISPCLSPKDLFLMVFFPGRILKNLNG